MHLIRRPERAMTVATRWRDGSEILEYHPRSRAIQWLREKVTDGQAGVDPFDASVFILIADNFERVWGYRACELTGYVLSKCDEADGGQRLRVVLEADVRLELDLDTDAPPLMADEALASRGVDSPTAVMDAVFGVLPEARPTLYSVPVDPETEAARAMRTAKNAYDERYPEGA